MDAWWFPTISIVKVWFIIQLKQPLKKWLFRVTRLRYRSSLRAVNTWSFERKTSALGKTFTMLTDQCTVHRHLSILCTGNLHPQSLIWNLKMMVSTKNSFPRGWFSGSMLNFRGVRLKLVDCFPFYARIPTTSCYYTIVSGLWPKPSCWGSFTKKKMAKNDENPVY